MSKANQLNKLFPGLASGPPQLGGGTPPPRAGTPQDGAPRQLSAAELHFKNLLAGGSAGAVGKDAGAAASGASASGAGTGSGAATAAPAASPVAAPVAAGCRVWSPDAGSALRLATSPVSLMTTPRGDGDEVGCKVASSELFLAYAIKDAQVRVIHTASVKSVLLRHAGRVADVRFNPRLPSLVATCALDGFCVVWDLRFDEGAGMGGSVQFREALRLAMPPGQQADMVCWNPGNERALAVVHGGAVSLLQVSGKLMLLVQQQQQQQQQAQGLPVEAVRVSFAVDGEGGARARHAAFGSGGRELVVAFDDGSLRGYPVHMPAEGAEAPPFALAPQWEIPAAHPGGLALALPLSTLLVSAARLVDPVALAKLGAGEHATSLRLWARSPQGLHLVHELVVLAAGAVLANPTSAATLLIADSWHGALFVVRVTPNGFETPLQYQTDGPALSIAARGTPDGKSSLIAQQTAAIVLLDFDARAAPVQQLAEAEPQVPATSPLPPQAAKTLERQQSSNLVSPAELLNLVGAGAAGARAGSVGGVPAPVMAMPIPTMPVSAVVMSPRHGVTTPPPQPQPQPQPPAPLPAQPAGPVVLSAAAVPEAHALPAAAALDALMERHFEALYQRLSADANERARKDVERQKSLLAVLSKSLNEIAENVEEAVKGALEDEAVAASLGRAIAAHSDPAALARQLAHEVRPAVGDAFATAFRDNLAPAFDAGCRSVVEQVSAFLPQAMEQQRAIVERMDASLGELAQRQTDLARQVYDNEALHAQQQQQQQQQRKRSLNNGAAPVTSAHPAWPSIIGHFQNGDVNGALFAALSEKDVQLVVTTLKLIDPDLCFVAGAPPVLNTLTLLILMQQLSTDLRTETVLKLNWIQRAGLAIQASEERVNSQGELMQMVVNNMDQSRGLFQPGSPTLSLYSMCYNVVQGLAYIS
jgi:hypothetical protein